MRDIRIGNGMFAAARLLVVALAAILAVSALAPATRADDQKPMRGVALIIGNSDYESLTPLPNPKADTEAIEKLFDDLGFETFDARDADARRLRRTMQRFVEDADGADIALVYYAGHGVEAGGENYLVPVDASIASLDDATEKLVPLSAFLKELREVVPMSIVLLDACRDNPFPPGTLIRATPDAAPQPLAAAGLGETRAMTSFKGAGGKSSGPVRSTRDDSLGTLIGFAAEPGATAMDGEPGENSPYAAAVLRHVPAMAGEELSTVMRMVAEEVYLKTDGRQRPWVNESLRRLVYLGSTPAPVEGAEGDILRERRQLLVNIAALPDAERRKVEAVAKDGGVSMGSVYGMLAALGTDAPKNPDELEARLREQIARIKELEGERAAIRSTDPEIVRLTRLADEAVSDGALKTALDLHEQAKARVRKVSNTVDEAEADIKARRLEFAEVYAGSAKANFTAFNYEQAARDYEEAFRQAERWDDFSAWSYRGNQAVALMESGWKTGATENLRISADLARDIVRMSERLDDRAHWALSQTFLGNTLMTLGQRTNDQAMIGEAVKAYDAALTFYTPDRPDYSVERFDVLQNLAGAVKQVAQRYAPKEAEIELRKALKLYDDLLAAVPRSVDALDWAETAASKAALLTDLARLTADKPMMRASVDLLKQTMEAQSGAPDAEKVRSYCLIAVAWSEVGIGEKDKSALEESERNAVQCLALTDKALTPVAWVDNTIARALNLQNIYLQTEDPVWLDQAIPLMREAHAMQDPAALPIEYRSLTTSLGGALLDLGRSRKQAEPMKEALSLYEEALTFFDPAKDVEEWADAVSRLADVERNLGQLEGNEQRLEVSLEGHRKALAALPAERFPKVAADIRQRISWMTVATSRLEDKLPEDVAIALLRRTTAALDAPQADWPQIDGPLSSAEAELGRRLYIKAIRTNETAGLREAADHLRRALVPAARSEDFNSWRTTNANLALTLSELARIENDNRLLIDSIPFYREAISSAAKPEDAVLDRRRLAEAYDKLSADGDPDHLRNAAAAWLDAARNLGDDAPVNDRATAWENHGIAIANLAFYVPQEAATANPQAIAAYRKALPLYQGADHQGDRERVTRNMAGLLRVTGINANDAAMLAETADLYESLNRRARTTNDPNRTEDELNQASVLLALARQKQDAALFGRAIALFKGQFGDGVTPPIADWRQAASYAAALRELGYLERDGALIGKSGEVLSATLARPGSDLSDADKAVLRLEQAETDIYLGDIMSDFAAIDRSVAIYRETLAMPDFASNPQYMSYLQGRIATGRLLQGEVADDTAAYKDGVTQTRALLDNVSRTANPAQWSQFASDLAFGIARIQRAGDASSGTIEEAVRLARDAVTELKDETSESMPYARAALCNALIEQGRASSQRSTIEEGLEQCRMAISALTQKKRMHTVARLDATVTYAQGILGKL
ncbi:MAG: caspase family protein [Mesorhizobium sp.]